MSVKISRENARSIPIDRLDGLLDYEVIVLKARSLGTTEGYFSPEELEIFEHWRSETSRAIALGKLVIFVLSPTAEQAWHAGEFIPAKIFVNKDRGRRISWTSTGRKILSDWPLDGYGGTLSDFADDATVVAETQSASLPVGLIQRASEGGGTLLVMPSLKVEEGIVEYMVGLRERLLCDTESLPAPDWVREERYLTTQLARDHESLQRLQADISRLTEQESSIEASIRTQEEMFALLYGDGPILEMVVERALSAMGYDCESNVNVEGEELDVVFRNEAHVFVAEVGGS